MTSTRRIALLIDEQEYGTIHALSDWIDWTAISKEPLLDEDFIREFAEYLDWEEISLWQRGMSDDFIEEHSEYIDWEAICTTGCLSEYIIREFPDDVYWDLISHAAPSEDLIRDFEDRVDWESISSCQVLSIPFIKEYSDRVHWDCISRYQKITDELCDAFYDKLDWDIIAYEKKLTYMFIKKYSEYIPKVRRVLNIIKNTSEAKDALIECTPLPDTCIENILEYLL